MSQTILIEVPLADLQRFARNLASIDRDLESGPQIQRTHQHLVDLVKSIMDVLPPGLFGSGPVQTAHSPSVASAPTPAVISRAPQVTAPTSAPANRVQLGRTRVVPAALPPPAAIEQPPAQTFQELGGGVVAVEGAPLGNDPQAALEALQRVMPGAEVTPVTATGKAMANALAHPLPNADAAPGR